MGDYNKLIVSCTVNGSIKEELQVKIEELELGTSAYQSQEHTISIKPGSWDHIKNHLEVILVGQTKYGRGQSEFCEWLRPNVIQGSGRNDVFAISFSEYSDTPTLWKISNYEEEY